MQQPTPNLLQEATELTEKMQELGFWDLKPSQTGTPWGAGSTNPPTSEPSPLPDGAGRAACFAPDRAAARSGDPAGSNQNKTLAIECVSYWSSFNAVEELWLA